MTDIKGLAYNSDWESSKKRWEAFWQQEVFDRPIIRLFAPRNKPIKNLLSKAAYIPQFRSQPELEFHNFDQMLRRTWHTLATQIHMGEALPVFDHKWSVAQALAWGCKPEYNEHAAWCHPIAPPLSENDPIFANEKSEGWNWLLNTACSAAAASDRNFFVRPDWGNHTGDILATLIGNYEMLTMIPDDPERIKRLIREITLSLNHLYQKMYEVIQDTGNEGTVNYIGCWSPDRCICLDCDISCMLSVETFTDLFLEPIIETMQVATHRMYHLDGPGAIHLLPVLLDISELHGIQWVPGAGNEPIAQWISMLQKIQKAGKSLWVSIQPEELPLIQKELSPQGLCITIFADSESDSQFLLEKAGI